MTLSELSVSELPRLEAWKSKGSFTTVLDVELFHICSDNSSFFQSSPSAEAELALPRLLIVHGFPTASFDFHKVYDDLSAKFAVFLWDMAGYGFSEKVYRTVQEQVDLVDALFRSLLKDKKNDETQSSPSGQAEKLHVLSHDLGDTVVQEMLARQQHKEEQQLAFSIQSVVMLNGGILPRMHRPTIMQQLLLVPCLNQVLAQLVSITLFQKSICKVFGPDTQPTEQEIQEYYALVRCNGGEKLTTENIKYMQERQVYCDRWVDAIKMYAAAAAAAEQQQHAFLLIDGPADPVSGRHLAEAVRDEVEGARVVFLEERVGHWPQVEAPVETLKAFMNFHADIRTFAAA